MREDHMIRKHIHKYLLEKKEVERIQPHSYRQSLSNIKSRNILPKE